MTAHRTRLQARAAATPIPPWSTARAAIRRVGLTHLSVLRRPVVIGAPSADAVPPAAR